LGFRPLPRHTHPLSADAQPRAIKIIEACTWVEVTKGINSPSCAEPTRRGARFGRRRSIGTVENRDPRFGCAGSKGEPAPSACGPPPPLELQKTGRARGLVRSGCTRMGFSGPLAARLSASSWIYCPVMGGPGLSELGRMFLRGISWTSGNIWSKAAKRSLRACEKVSQDLDFLFRQ
jgi:hypothetical protein